MKPIVECHTHSTFSPDAINSCEEMLLTAIANGTKHYCFTDHMDMLYIDKKFYSLDIPKYIETIDKLKEKYSDQIYINCGIELGYTKKNEALNNELMKKYKFDFVISSVHEVNGIDCYSQPDFGGKTREQAFTEYLQAILDSVSVPYHIDSVAHISYISRYVQYEDKLLEKGQFDNILTKIFNKMIERNLILELNSHIKNLNVDCLPYKCILEKYYDCGGRLITFATDAHLTTRLGDRYDTVATLAKKIGFKNWTVKENGKFKEYNF